MNPISRSRVFRDVSTSDHRRAVHSQEILIEVDVH